MGKSSQSIVRASIPVFGPVIITLGEEAEYILRIFKEEIERLRAIPHLGLIHYVNGIPRYSRYDHILTMLTFIDKIANMESNLRLTKSIRLRNGVEYKSLHDFLKSWSLIYSIGHFYLTFTAEHGFMIYLLSNKKKPNFKNNFIEFVKKIIKNHYQDDKKISELMIKEANKIIFSEDIMRIYKIFTLLLMLSRISTIVRQKELGYNQEENQEEIKKLLEFSAFVFLRRRYLDLISNKSQRDKLEKVIEYFELLRMLAFTVLDGYLSSKYIQLNAYPALEELDKFIETQEYRRLLNEINRFYTSTIYQAPESMYYHHLLVWKIHDMFNSYNKDKTPLLNPSKLLQDLQNKTLDIKIKNVFKQEVSSATLVYDTPNGILDKYDNIRLKIPVSFITNPMTHYIESFQENSIIGGLMFDIPERQYILDLYLNKSANLSSIPSIWDIIKTIKPIYSTIQENTHDYPFFPYKIMRYNIFTPLAKYILKHAIYNLRDIKTMKFKFLGFPLEIRYPLLFEKCEIRDIMTILEYYLNQGDLINRDKKIEIKYNKEALGLLRKIESPSKFFVHAPSISLSFKDSEQELDYLLLGFSPNSLEIYLGEVKSNRTQSATQLTKELMKVLDLSEDAIKPIVKKSKETYHYKEEAELGSWNFIESWNLWDGELILFRAVQWI